MTFCEDFVRGQPVCHLVAIALASEETWRLFSLLSAAPNINLDFLIG